MLFVNTRPSDRAAALSAALSQQGIAVFELPLLELQALNYDAKLAQLFAQLTSAQVIVVVSPTAVEIGMHYLKQSGIHLADLTQLQWVAVGLKTAELLATYGIQALVPQVETSEGMLQLPCLKQLGLGSKIAFWRGEGGRQFMMQQLQDTGMQILNFVLYQRQCPAQSINLIPLLLDKIRQHRHYSVLISSEASWLNWLTLLEQHPDVMQHAQYLVLGSRLAELLSHYKNQQQHDFNIIELLALQPATILAQLALDKGKA
jgi:uroporphyrinogen-III synthase